MEGRIIEDPCADCYGQGRVEQERNLSVKVPPGVDNGDRIRLSGEGEAGKNSGPSGDLYVEIRVEPHTIFQREGADLQCSVPLSFATVALGGEVKVPTLEDSSRNTIGQSISFARKGRKASAWWRTRRSLLQS